jgi:HAD superfamily hydrolase (TIGR01548 family)
VLVFRTFSKAWGCAGLRVGYAAGDPRVITWLRSVGHPYPAASASLVAVSAALERGCGRPDGVVGHVRSNRARLAAELAALGAEPLPSDANFVLARFADAGWVHTGLAALGVAVRAFRGPALADHLRLTVPPDGADLDRLLAALRTVLAPAALLLDMDGVLADVSGSYRAAIVATAASFGVEVTAADIVRAKSLGDANNDWELTRRLVAAAGDDPGLAAVRERFEALYQGSPGQPGLRETERPLLTPEQLEILTSRRQVAVVTGRPRRDAERFLAEHGLAHGIATVVCMEDAPAKPDPAPVRLALDRLGVRNAWMVGDTVDDLRAARAARVLPVGVAAPGDDPATAAATLRSAGAARILDSVTDLLEVLR